MFTIQTKLPQRPGIDEANGSGDHQYREHILDILKIAGTPEFKALSPLLK